MLEGEGEVALGAHQGEVVRVLGRGLEKELDRVEGGGCAAALSSDGQGDDPEELGFDSAVPEPGDIDVSEERGAGEGVFMALGDVVVEEAHPEDGIGVEVDDALLQGEPPGAV